MTGRDWVKAQRAFARGTVLADDAAEGERRADAGLPGGLLNHERWRKRAFALAGRSAEAVAIVDALLARADRWGVVDPDVALARATFERDGTQGFVDLRTGEALPRGFTTVDTELWLSAVTGLHLQLVKRVVARWQGRTTPIISFWQIPGDLMHGKAELMPFDLDDDDDDDERD